MIYGKIRHFRALAIAASLVTAASVAENARAQDGDPPAVTDPAAEARQQYAAGGQAFVAKRYVEAALHFEAAAAQRAHAVTLYTAALAWEQANRPERACDDYARALDVPGLSAQQTASAHERVAALEKTLGTVAITAPEGWRVQLVGLSEVLAPARLHATPGAHELVVRAPNRAAEKRDVTLEIGQTLKIDLQADAAPPVPAAKEPAKQDDAVAKPQTPPSSFASLRRSAGFAAVGVGVAALGAGVILGLEALDGRDTYNTTPSRATFDHAQSLQTWTNVTFVAGALITAGGLVLVLLPESTKPPTQSAQTARTARLTFAPTLGGGVLGGAF